MTEKNISSKGVAESRTEQVHLVMKPHLNAMGRLFGGLLMQWIDEVATVVAMRHAGTQSVTTVAVDNLQFKSPTYEGEMLVLIGYITAAGSTSMEIEIDTYVERSDGMRYSVNRAFFVVVALDENEKPTSVPPLKIQTEAEKARQDAAILRREMRKNRSRTGF